MARHRTMSIAKINIEMERPHSPSRYIDLFKFAFSLRQYAKVYGDQSLIFTHIDQEDDIIIGLIGKFTKIDLSSGWLDTKN